MIERLKSLVLRLMRVPPEPHPPAGAEGSVRVFRASRRYFQLNLARWGLRQAMALAGILFALAVLGGFEFGANTIPELVQALSAEDEEAQAELGELTEQLVAPDILERPSQLMPLLRVAEALGLLLFVAQLPFTYTLVRLDFDLRWYMVTDRSLRIREGIVRVNELTLTFANVQDVSIRQNPIQRLLGISDLRVQTAGGGGGDSRRGPGGKEESGHIGYFHGLDDAEAIRDLILDRLRQLRGAGLGDPDAATPETAPLPPDAPEPDLTGSSALAAAREVLLAARALRRTVGGSTKEGE